MNVITLSTSGTTVGHERTRGTFNNSIDAERSQTENAHSLQGWRKTAARRFANHLMEKSAKEQFRKFVENNILSRDCTKYIPKRKANQDALISQDNTCCCGYSKQWHMKRNIDVDQDEARGDINRGKTGITLVSNPRNDDNLPMDAIKWDESIHIRNFSNKCYGLMQFSGFEEDESRYPVPYVRISTKNSLKPALQLLTEHWLLRRPKLVVSILGSDENIFKREIERTAFKKAVVDLIQNTGGFSTTAPGRESEISQGAWVITNGFASGAAHCVAEAINEYAARVSLVERLDLVVIGVCHWGSLDGTDMLTPSENGGFFPASYKKRILLNEASRREKPAKILDCNHTHFIFYDNGKGKDDDLQIWRGELENYIASELMVIRRGRDVEWLKYPVVRILVNGNAKEIETAKKTYGSIPGFKIPLLILEEHKNDEKARTKETKGLIPKSKKHISAGSLITTYFFESDSRVIDLKELIRNAVLSSNFESTTPPEVQGLIAAGLIRQVSEASAMHRSLQEIRSGSRLREFLLYSLINKQHEMVELILNSGADLEEFLTIDTIKILYLQILDDTDEDLRSTFLRQLIKKQKLFNQKDEWKKLKAVGCLLSELIGHDHNNNYTAPWIENNLTEDESEKQGIWERGKLQSPHKHLMLWAILCNLDKMALLFWKTGTNHIGCALVAANLSKNLAKKAQEMEMDDFFENYNSLADTFEYQATNVLHNCYLQNTRLTELCLIRMIEDLGYCTALTLAHDAELMVFMEHVSYQKLLDSIWMCGMAPTTSLLKVAGTALFPFLLILCLRFVRQSFAEQNGENVLRSRNAVSTVTEGAGSAVPETLVDTRTIEVEEKKGTYFRLFPLVGNPDRWIELRKNYGTALRFFFSAPATKFVYSTMSYITFLFMFSVFILHEFAQWTGPAGSRFEIVIWIWAVALLGEILLKLITEVFDVIIFIGILAVFLFSFGIAYRALQYPKAQLNVALLENILYHAYFIIFGQVQIQEVIRDMVPECNNTIQSSNFGEKDACPQASWLADIYLALYCFIANILVINLLIAMFNFTFRKVQMNSKRHWKCQRFSLVREFYHQPYLPAPLSLPFCIVKLLALCCRRKSKDRISGDAFERKLTAEETRQVLALERRAMERVTTLINDSSLTISQRSLAVQEKLDIVLEEAKRMHTSLDSRNCQTNKRKKTDTQT